MPLFCSFFGCTPTLATLLSFKWFSYGALIIALWIQRIHARLILIVFIEFLLSINDQRPNEKPIKEDDMLLYLLNSSPLNIIVNILNI